MPAMPGQITRLKQTSFSLEAPLTLSGIIIGPIVVIALQFLFYGFYIMAFTVCMMVLKRRNRTPERTFHFVLVISLFALATIGLGSNAVLAILQAASHFYQWDNEDHTKFMSIMSHLLPAFEITSISLTMLTNILADIVLVFRCYAIWNFRKSVIIIPTIACIVSNCIGIVSMGIELSVGLSPTSKLGKWMEQAIYLEGAYFILNALINVILTFMVGEL
ncbi:hypothetical protein L218DRAFT_310374 [Marasmius fiardii PR-910]|nr:hypothetical protein L218DRAFT_310374 [Marasmius fiardii PR-910]